MPSTKFDEDKKKRRVKCGSNLSHKTYKRIPKSGVVTGPPGNPNVKNVKSIELPKSVVKSIELPKSVPTRFLYNNHFKEISFHIHNNHFKQL